MFGAELVIVLLAIYLGARLGGIGIGFAGGLGVLVLTLIFQIKPGAIPFDVIEIIMAVIAAIAAMQVAGGMDYLVSLAERMLRRHPKYITFLAPLVTWFMTILAGTGHTAFSTLPVITEVAKEQGIRPSRPLSIAVVASQIAITASPISAAVVFFAGILEPMGVSYLTLLAICIPVTLIAVMITAVLCNFLGAELKDDPVYQERLAKGEVRLRGSQVFELKPHAKRSVLLFLIGIQLRNNGMTLKQIVLNRRGMIIAVMVVASSMVAGVINAFILDLPLKTGLAMASGFGWYSLSGILLTESFGPVIGSAAFFNDLARELIAIMLIPGLVRRSRSTALGLCGATSMDFTLPVLQRSGGLEMVPAAIVHGFILSLLVPILMAFFSA